MRAPVFLATVLVCVNSFADQKSCDNFANLAHNIMKARQSGVPMKSVMGAIEIPDAEDNLKKLMKGMVVSAYERPRFLDEELKSKEVSDFEDINYLSCVKS